MNNELYMNNYLLILKSTIEVYVHGTLESSNPDVRKALKKGLEDTLTHQADTYDEMTDYGWYVTNNVPIKDIDKIYNKVNKKC